MEHNKLKKVYIVLTYTGTIPSKIIKFYTKDEYSHVSISLDEKLNNMYSFARLNAYNPFQAGFIHEKLNYGTFKRFKNTKAEIYSLCVTNEQYEKIKEIIINMEKNKNIYKYNLVGLIAQVFNIKYQTKNSFYCSEFIKYLIEEAKINVELPELIKPLDFKKINNLELEYKGILKNYSLIND